MVLPSEYDLNLSNTAKLIFEDAAVEVNPIAHSFED